jgi:hypothetical protein
MDQREYLLTGYREKFTSILKEIGYKNNSQGEKGTRV